MIVTRHRSGYSLVEVLWAAALFSLFFAGAFALLQDMHRAYDAQRLALDARQEARQLIHAIEREVRLASRASMEIVGGRELRYQVPRDVDGHGVLVDETGRIDLAPQRTIRCDNADENKDGMAGNQLVIDTGSQIRVLGNYLVAPGTGAAHPVHFEMRDNGVYVKIMVGRRGGGTVIRETFIWPRNP